MIRTGPPCSSRVQCLSLLKKIQIARQEFEHVLEFGIIHPSDSPWVSLLATHSAQEFSPRGIGENVETTEFPTMSPLHTRPISYSSRTGFFRHPPWNQELFKYGPNCQSLPSDTSTAWGCSKTAIMQHPIQPLGIRRTHIPKVYGPDVAWTLLLN